MGGKRYGKRIGMNRPKKKKARSDTIMTEPIDGGQGPPSSLASSPERLQAQKVTDDIAVVTAVAQDVVEDAPPCMTPLDIVNDLLANVARAEARLATAQRSWEKTKLTYSNKQTHSLWDYDSVVKRDDARCLAADQQLGEARASLAWHKDRLTRHRTFFKFAERMLDRPHDPVVRMFYRRAYTRVMTVPAVASWESMWPGICAGNIWDWNSRQYGLALTRGLTHVDML